MCRPYVCAQTVLVCLIENEKGIKLKGLEFTETKLRVSRRHKRFNIELVTDYDVSLPTFGRGTISLASCGIQMNLLLRPVQCYLQSRNILHCPQFGILKGTTVQVVVALE